MWRHFTLFIAEGFHNFRFRFVVSLCSGLLARSTLQLRTVSCSYHESFVPLLDLRLREARLVYQCVEVIFAQFRIAIAHPCIGDSSRPAPMNDATAEHTNNTTWLLLYVMSACVCLSVFVTSRCSIETTEQIELGFSAWRPLSTYSDGPSLHCVVCICGISKIAVYSSAFLRKFVPNSEFRKMSPRHVDPRKCCQLSSTDDRSYLITLGVNKAIDDTQHVARVRLQQLRLLGLNNALNTVLCQVTMDHLGQLTNRRSHGSIHIFHWIVSISHGVLPLAFCMWRRCHRENPLFTSIRSRSTH